MPPATEKEALEREIARLSGAITNHGPIGGSGNASRAARGRPGNHPYKKSSQQVKRGNRTLIVNNSSRSNYNNNAGDTETNALAGPSRLQPVGRLISGPPSANESTATTPSSTDSIYKGVVPGWVKGTTKSGNKTLTNVDVHLKAEKARQVRDAQPRPPKPKRASRQLMPVYGSVETRTPGGSANGKTVVIDGVVFQFDKDGQKLTRMDEPSTPTPRSVPSTSNPSFFGTPTRSSLSMSGRQYIRTKNGNMISAEVVRNRKASFGGAATQADTARRREKIDKPCRFFTKTGQCQRASTCPYTHDPDRLAICSRFLRGNCPLDATTCPVSHTPTSHNAPSCSHYQMMGHCKNGFDCLYPHVRISADAPVCQAFAVEGWCEKGEDCLEKHAWECREFNEKGVCGKQGRCALAHVLRAKSGVQQHEPPQVVDYIDVTPSRVDDTPSPVDPAPTRGALFASVNDIAEQQDFIQFLSGAEDTADSDDASEDSSVSSEDDDGDGEKDEDEDEDGNKDDDATMTQ